MTHYNHPGLLPNYLTTIEGLNKLLVDRQNAGYVRREPLDPFILQGRWILDRCGNMGFAQWPTFGTGHFVRDVFPNIPEVLTQDQYETFVASQPGGINLKYPIAICDAYVCVPPVGTICTICGKVFTVEDAHTAQSWRRRDLDTFEVGPEFIGLTYAELPRAILEQGGRVVHLKATTLIGKLKDGSRLNAATDGYGHVFAEGDAMVYMHFSYQHRECKIVNQ